MRRSFLRRTPSESSELVIALRKYLPVSFSHVEVVEDLAHRPDRLPHSWRRIFRSQTLPVSELSCRASWIVHYPEDPIALALLLLVFRDQKVKFF